MTAKANIKRQSGLQKHDYPAAAWYLSLTMGPQAKRMLSRNCNAPR